MEMLDLFEQQLAFLITQAHHMWLGALQTRSWGSNTSLDTARVWKIAEPSDPQWFHHLFFSPYRGKLCLSKSPQRTAVVCVTRILRSVMFCHSPPGLGAVCGV